MTNSLDQMQERGTAEPVLRRARRPWGRLFLTLALLIVTIMFAAWLQRRTIARAFVDRELASRGVRAQYQIEQLSPWHQRLTNLVLGDPRNPDLVADWVELGTSLSPWSAKVLVLRAGRVRVRGQVIDGRLSLGALDRLMPPPSGKPFDLPHVKLAVADAALRLESDYGAVAIAVAGSGMLDDGFAGTARVTAPQFALSGCSASQVMATLRLRIRGGRPAITGPLTAAAIRCDDARAVKPRFVVDAGLGAGLDTWTGTANVAIAGLSVTGRALSDIRGQVSFDGDARAMRGKIALRAGRFVAPEASGAGLHLLGDYRQAADRLEYRGALVGRSLALPRAVRDRIGGYAAAARGTPLSAVAERIGQAASTAAAAFDASTDLSIVTSRAGLTYHIARFEIAAASGARMSFDRGRGVTGTSSDGRPGIDGTLTLRGGGLPEATARLVQRPGDDRLDGVGFLRPYAVSGASLALSRISFSVGSNGGTVRTAATMSGPVAGGRVDGLALPLDARWRGKHITLNPRCTPISYARIAIAGTELAPGLLNACPTGAGLIDVRPNGVEGGIRFVQPVLVGRAGSSPLRLEAADARINLGPGRFAISDIRAQLGAERSTRLDIESLEGGWTGRIAGVFAGLSGQIGAVPLIISEAAGEWRLRDAGLSLAAKLQLTDAAPSARFHPLISDDGVLRLAGNEIVATAGLKSRAKGVHVARVEIRHDLGDGRGSASIVMPPVQFAEGGLQPADLTPLAFGVVADVTGAVEGQGRVVWSPEGVSSSGNFATRSMDLAAAFGPVRGLATELQFEDLLNVRTKPGQRATTAEINPGVPVRDGTIRFRLLDSQRVQIEGARWPFAGGELVLEPTILDFSERRERRMTFRVTGADAALFLKEMEFDNLDATGTFDGTLPMVFDEKGGRIEGGSLRARGSGSLAYVGEVSQRDLGVWGNMAFQALKALDYRSLTIDMNGPIAGDMVTEIRFAGVSQGKGTKSNFLLRRLAKLPFIFNVRVRAPFKQLLDSVQSWYDPQRLIERNLPALLDAQERADKERSGDPVQPRESGEVR